MAPETADRVIGRQLEGRYQITARVARGGMATVYQAYDQRLDRTVAVKIMHPELAADPAFVDRFIREARSAARLSHPGVVAIHDQGADNGTLYLVMEYLAGTNLRDLIDQRGALPPARALEVLERVTDALSAAHQRDLIHRDIKPENVLLGLDHSIKVADFGLARPLTGAHTATSGGSLMGTVAYLAPEQILYGGGDKRSDIFACGIIAYELLTAHKPFAGEAPINIAYQHVHTDVPPPSQTVTGIPAAVDALVRAATHRDPQQRPADASALLGLVRHTRTQLQVDPHDPGISADLAAMFSALPVPVPPAAPQAAAQQAAPSQAPQAPQPPGAVGHPSPASTSGPAAARAQSAPPAQGGHQQAHPSFDPPGPPAAGQSGIPAAAAPATAGPAAGPPSGTTPPGGDGSAQTPQEAVSKRRKAPLIALVGLLVLLVAGAVGGLAYYDSTKDEPSNVASESGKGAGGSTNNNADNPDKSRQRSEVPALKGKNLSAAIDALSRENLRLGQVTYDYDSAYAMGQVIDQFPAMSEQVKPDSSVNIVVSRGSKSGGEDPAPAPSPSASGGIITLPDGSIFTASVWGMPQAEARKQLTEAGLKVKAKTKQEPNVLFDKGEVIRTQPLKSLRKGDSVTLVVSSGPK